MVCKVIAACVVFAGAVQGAEDRETVWNGVYTEAQAGRGQAVYRQECSRCHGEDLSGYRSALKGERFLEQWREDSLRSLFNRIKTMPPSAPASLPDSVYIELVAYLLRENSFPAGGQQLEEKGLAHIWVQGKTGPQAVPDFSLVEVVGCLAKDAAGKWLVSRASEPVRTRNPFESSAAELAAAAPQAMGRHTFRILDASNLPAGLRDMDKVKAKGFLIRKAEDDRLNITSVERLAGTCGQ